MRSELGKISLDTVFKERELLNIAIVESINKAAHEWGLTCLRYEIRDIKLPERVQEAMQMQVEAERKKRAQVLESEGTREAEINVAEGENESFSFCFTFITYSTFLSQVKSDLEYWHQKLKKLN